MIDCTGEKKKEVNSDKKVHIYFISSSMHGQSSLLPQCHPPGTIQNRVEQGKEEENTAYHLNIARTVKHTHKYSFH